MIDVLEDDVSLDGVVGAILKSETKWNVFIRFAETIMSTKEETERARHQRARDEARALLRDRC